MISSSSQIHINLVSENLQSTIIKEGIDLSILRYLMLCLIFYSIFFVFLDFLELIKNIGFTSLATAIFLYL